jgi:hypothetical protein
MPVLVDSNPRQTHPAGITQATIVEVVDQGIVKSEKYGPKHRILIAYQSEMRDKDGKPIRVTRSYGAAIDSSLSELRKVILASGKTPAPNFDVETLIGTKVLIAIENATQPDGTVFSNVTAVFPLTARGEASALANVPF